MGRILNSIMDRLQVNRKKAKVTYYDQYNREHDLRAKIKDNRLMIVAPTKEGAIDINVKINSRPIWDKGDRYIVIEGMPETINPQEVVKNNFQQFSGLRGLTPSIMWQLGKSWGELMSRNKIEDLLKYSLYISIGIGALLLIVTYFLVTQLEGLDKAVVDLGNRIAELKTIQEGAVT